MALFFRVVNKLVIFSVFIAVLFSDFLPLSLGGYASQRLVLSFVIIFYVLSFVWVRANEKGWPSGLYPCALLVFAFLLLSMPFRGQAYVWIEPGMYAGYFLSVVLAGSIPRAPGNRQEWVHTFVVAGGIAAAFYGCASLTVYVFALSDGVSSLSKYIPWGFVNIRYWSHIATWLLPILPLAVLVGPLKDERLWKFFVGLGAALWWWIVFLSTSRGTMVSVAFGVMFVALLMGRPALPWLRVFLRYLAFGVVAWLVLSVLIPSVLVDEVTLRQIKSDTSGRMPLFIEAWRMSLVNFPFGMGPQSWLTHEIITDAYQSSQKFGHPHNMYLMWAAEYGWILIFAMLLLVVQAIYRFWKRRCEIQAMSTTDGRQIQAVSLAAFTASVSAALVHAGASAVFMAPGSMLIGFLVLSIFWALISPSVDTPSSSSWGRRVLAVSVAGIAGILWVLWFGEVLDYYHAMENDLVDYQENGSGGMMPRFWFHGNFPRAGQ